MLFASTLAYSLALAATRSLFASLYVSAVPFASQDASLGAVTRSAVAPWDYPVLLFARRDTVLVETPEKRAPLAPGFNYGGNPDGNKGENQKPGYVAPKYGLPKYGMASNTTNQQNKTYSSTVNPKTKVELSKFCDATGDNEDRNTKQLLFTNPNLDRLSDTEVKKTLSKQCFHYQDTAAPQYSNKVQGYYDAKHTEPKVEGTFSGGRVPGSGHVYAVSCELQIIKNPKWYENESNAERVTQQVNPYGNNGAFTAKFLNATGSQPYKGNGNFCQGSHQ